MWRLGAVVRECCGKTRFARHHSMPSVALCHPCHCHTSTTVSLPRRAHLMRAYRTCHRGAAHWEAGLKIHDKNGFSSKMITALQLNSCFPIHELSTLPSPLTLAIAARSSHYYLPDYTRLPDRNDHPYTRSALSLPHYLILGDPKKYPRSICGYSRLSSFTNLALLTA